MLFRVQPLEELLDPFGDEGVSDLEAVDHRRAIIPVLDHPILADEAEALEVAAEGNNVAFLRERLCVYLLPYAMARIDAALAQAFDHMRRNLGIGFGARGRRRERGATGAGEPTHMLGCDQ